MDLHERYKDIVEQYPKKITKIQFCEITGICKSSAGRMLQDGRIQCKKRNKRLLHYYDISLTEALQHKFNKDLISILLSEHSATVLSYYEKRLKSFPDALSPKDLKAITGYTLKSIERWLLDGEIEAYLINCKYKVAKEDLIKFLVSNRYFAIQRKSAQHLADIEIIKEISLA